MTILTLVLVSKVLHGNTDWEITQFLGSVLLNVKYNSSSNLSIMAIIN